MFMAVMFVLALVTVPLAGGRLGNLGRVRIRATWSLLLAVALQLLIIDVLKRSVDQEILAVAHLCTYAVAAVFVVTNWRLSGMRLIAAGACLNLLAIAANKGIMPADPDALRTAGRAIESEFDNSTYVPDAKLPLLGDIFAIPQQVPLANVFSIGDAMIFVGGLIMLHWICESRLIPARLRARRPPPQAEAAREEPDERSERVRG